MSSSLSFSTPLRRSLLGTFFGVCLCASAHAQEGTAPANQPDSPAPAPTVQQPPTEETPAEDAPKPGISLGAEVWYGTSNLPGFYRFRDGFWLGSGAFYPSNIYGVYNGKDGLNGKVSVSIGKYYNGSTPGFDQPIEAYVSKPVGKTTLTAGKFYVPFELMEWQYETEFGLQAARELSKKSSLTTAVTYNRARETPNFYARYAHTMGPATIGLSLGAGRGFSFDTDHDRGAALDLTVERGRFRFEGTTFLAQQSSASSQFLFAFARLNYQLTPKANLYISRHSFNDRLEQQGKGQFSTIGAVYQLNKHLSLEGAFSRSGELDRNINFIELHYAIER